MRMKKLLRYLSSWKEEGLISEEQMLKISHKVKNESHEYRSKLIKVLFVVGGFWIVFGTAAAFKMIKLDLMVAFAKAIYGLCSPLINFIKSIAPRSYIDIINGVSCLIGWFLFQVLGAGLHKRSGLRENKISYLQEKRSRVGTTSITISYILASAAWIFFNIAFYNEITATVKDGVFVPVFSFVAVVFFLGIAYKKKDQIALLFSMGFLSHAVGMITGYFHACYYLSVSMPITQLGVGVVLILVGTIHVLKTQGDEDSCDHVFGRTYEAVGLLFVFLSLWIMSLWGFMEKENYWTDPHAVELWISNIAFIGSSLGVMYYGAMKEDKLYYKYGITFFIIGTYTIFFSHLWETVGAAFGSLLLGVLMISTGYWLRYTWLKGRGVDR